MPFSYRMAESDPAGSTGVSPRATLVVCNLGEKQAALRAIGIARELVGVSGRDVVLLSETRALAGPAVSDALRPDVLDRLAVHDVFVAIDRKDRASLSPRMISVICGLRLASVKRINPRGKTAPYARPEHDGAKRALLLFPGIFVPPRIGSHQRAFSTALDLIADGFEVDVMIKRQGPRLFERVRPYFSLFASRLEAYEIAGLHAEPTTARSAAEPGYGLSHRRSSDVDADLTRRLDALLAERRYALVVATFPWMLAAFEGLDLRGAKLVCDTHDVISNRHRDLAAEDGHGVSDDDERAEGELLGRCDAVLAISRSDAKLFRRKLGLQRVVVHPISYYPAEPTTPWRNVSRPLVFGFLGSDMEPNRRALQHVMTEWWPVIQAFSPRSEIVIGGAVALSPGLSPYVMLRENVSASGPVEEVGLFFNAIDVLLSPTLVQGGVNVKNVEALLRRRPVITNTLGARMMLPLVVPTRCDTPEGLLSLLRKIERNDPGLIGAIDKLFDDAAAYHGKSGTLQWA